MTGREAVERDRGGEHRDPARRPSGRRDTGLPADDAGERDEQRRLVVDDDRRVEPERSSRPARGTRARAGTRTRDGAPRPASSSTERRWRWPRSTSLRTRASWKSASPVTTPATCQSRSPSTVPPAKPRAGARRGRHAGVSSCVRLHRPRRTADARQRARARSPPGRDARAEIVRVDDEDDRPRQEERANAQASVGRDARADRAPARRANPAAARARSRTRAGGTRRSRAGAVDVPEARKRAPSR